MNRRDFYKELMKEYTFDSAKVRRFAKRSSCAGTRVSVKRWWHIPSTVAVAAASLTVGLIAFFYNSNPGVPVGGDIPVPPSTPGSYDSAEKVKLSFSSATVYLSFNDSMTFRELENKLYTISDTGNIVVETVYILDEVQSVAAVYEFDGIRNDDTVQIIGAKVSVPGRLIDEFERQTEIGQVVIATEDMDDDSFIPGAAAETQTSVVAVTLPPEEMIPAPESEVVAPIEKLVSLNAAGIIEADFISDYHFAAIVSDSVILYEISVDETAADLEINPVTEFTLHNHRMRYSASGNSMLISGCGEDLRRTILLLADAETGTLQEIDIKDLTESGELLFAFYDDINRRIIMRVRSADNNIIYVMNRDTLFAQTAFISSEGTAILAVNGNALYYSVVSGDTTAVYRFDIAAGVGAPFEPLVFNDTVSFERNADLSGFVVLTDNADGGKTARVFSANTEMLTNSVEVENGLIFYKNATDLLTDGENFYALSQEKANCLEVFDGYPSSNKRVMSELFSVFEITEKSVRILLK